MEKRFEVDDYVCDTKIGTGSFAEVWKGTHKVTKQQVAVKVIDLERISRSNNGNNESKLKQHLNSELKIMKSVDHKNIVKMFDFEESKTQIVMILELCEGGDYSKYIKKRKRLSEQRAKYFMQQLASGLEFLRDKGIIHRDLKPQNLLLSDTSDRPVLKIADFGFARYIDTQSMAHTLCGSPLYMAPEILEQKDYTVKADLWSVGVILYESLVGNPPYEAKNIVSLIHAVKDNKVKFPPTIQISKECMDLILSLLQKDPTQRMTWEEFFMHPWLGMHQPAPQQAQQSPQHAQQPPTQFFPHSKSQPNIHAPLPTFRSFLHDDRVLNQSPFGAFANNSASNTPTASPASHQHPPLPRSQSARDIPYKLPSAGNVPAPTPPSNITFANKNITDPKKRHSVALTGLSGAAPSNNNPNYPLLRTNISSSPPINVPSISTSPNSSFPKSLPNAPAFPLSSSPTYVNTTNAYQKNTSFLVDNTTPSNTEKVSNRAFPDTKLLAPKSTSSNSDSFEKDCVIMGDHMQSVNISDSCSSEEIEVLSEVDAKYRRAVAVAELGDMKIEIEMPYEAFAVYIKSVELFCQALDYAKHSVHTRNLINSLRIASLVTQIKEKATLYLQTVEYWKSILRPSETLPDAEKVIYYQALFMGRLAGVDEVWKNFNKSEQVYFTAKLLLESLLSDDADPSDKEILRTHIDAFSKRLEAVRSKKTNNSATNKV